MRYRVRKKGSFGKGVFSEKVNFLEILENLEILEFLENPQTVENKGESDRFLEILENLELCEKTPFVMTPFSGSDVRRATKHQAIKVSQASSLAAIDRRSFKGQHD